MRDLAAAMAAGTPMSAALVERCIARIRVVDPQMKAWIHVLEDEALQADHLGAERTAGSVRSPWHCIPSHSRADIATAIRDATLVAHLRAAGA